MGSVDLFHREFRTKRHGLPDLLRYDACVRPGVIIGKGGELITTFRYRGPDMQCACAEEINFLRVRVNEMVQKLAHGWMLHGTTLRTESVEYEDGGAFPDAVTRAIEDERVAQYRKEGAHFENDYYLTFTYLPDPILLNRIKSFAFEAGSSNPGSGEAHLQARTFAYFEAFIADAVSVLESGIRSKLVRLMPRLERDPGTQRMVWYEEQLAYLHECLTGLGIPIRVPQSCIPCGVDALIGSYSFIPGLRPRINGVSIRVVAIEGLPAAGTDFGILDVLNRLGVKFRWTTRWIAQSPEQAKANTRKVRSKWRQKIWGFVADLTGKRTGAPNLDAKEMAEDAEAVLQDVESGNVSYGYWASTVIFLHDDDTYLDSVVRYFLRSVGGLGFPCRDEDVNCVEAFLGSLPGHGYENVREPEIHSFNLADCLPLTSTWQGPVSNPCPFYKKYYPNRPVPPLFQGAASGGTPFRVVLHNGDVGHTALFGPTGAGKSTILGLAVASHFRYPGARVWAFEKGESMLALCLGAGGSHYSFMDDDPDVAGRIGLAPFVNLDRQTDRIWAQEYVEAILLLNGFKVDFDVSSELRRVVGLLATRPVEMRSFTDFNQLVQIRAVKEILSGYESDMAGGMLNARRDTLSGGRFTVFEMERLMEHSEKHVAPVLLYLFRTIERSLDGSPTMIVLDEAWLMLALELFAEKLKEWLKVLRKANAHVVFATQELQDVANSPIAPTVFAACKTRILLPNAEAGSDENMRLYKMLRLSPREIELIANATPKRDYFFSSPAGRRLFQLELGPVALAFFGASGVDDRKAIKELYRTYGAEWVPHWLRRQGLNPEAVLRSRSTVC
jgi:type IV secretion system protein VirB4